MFDECDTRNCVNVSIEDDLVVEMTESITVTLGIIDIPGQGNIIPDSDNVKDFINITDDDGMKLCPEIFHLKHSVSCKFYTHQSRLLKCSVHE